MCTFAQVFAAQPAGIVQQENVPNMIAEVGKSVVNVQTDRSFRSRRWRPPDFFEQYFTDFFERKDSEPRTIECQGEGTGVIIDAGGLVLTNTHVISDAETIRIVLNDKTVLPASVIGKNEKEDLALLKIEGERTFSAIRFGDSNSVKPADDVYAIGTPYGYSQTVTKGIVSAVHREFKRGGKVIYDDVIQTDASINPGNSGGPLLNSNGEMIGMIYLGDWRGEGIGFAIPVKKIENMITELKSSQKAYERQANFKRRFGFAPVEEKGKDGEKQLVIAHVLSQSIADKSGLKIGDVLVKFQDQYVRGLEHLIEEALKVTPGKRVYLEISRQKRTFFTYIEVRS
ncbi:MAG: hypothetical protein A3G87_06715 [Omnitrophica bacterium RIFCSPLOWO2_12_FULL_50_11]|nr:MAG: hypothetical protein A3G87_06715 [Omnitrophica bacterium RIFCSPLOWO2_12_FULL_50_11]